MAFVNAGPKMMIALKPWVSLQAA